MSVIETNDVFTINDIKFTVGASAIDVQQENLSYKFVPLRQSTSTKIPTGNGATVVNVNIAIVKEDIVKLHRLLIQIRRNPYCYVENKLIRQKIVPHWQSSQNMAFTVINTTIENIVGNVGLFNLNITMQWFNYFPMTHNFLFRQEWETQWLNVINNEEYKESLEYLGYDKASYIKKSINGYITNVREETHPPLGFGSTFEDNFKSWSGFIFDLLPVPSGMEKAFAVQTAAESQIYVRFYNELQRQALADYFNIDVRAKITNKPYYNLCDSGVFSIDDVLKQYNINIIDEMLSYDYFNLYFKVYKFLDLPSNLKSALNEQLNQIVEEVPLALVALGASPDSNEIPESIRQGVQNSELLLGCAPEFRPFIYQVLQKMLDGDNLTGRKYGGKLLINKATVRAIDSGIGVKNSLHEYHDVNGNNISFAVDLNYLGSGAIGSKLNKTLVNSSNLNDSKNAFKWALDYAYVINHYFKSDLFWGGNFASAGDKDSKEGHSTVISNINLLINAVSAIELNQERIDNGRGPLPLDYLKIIFPVIGDDPVHMQYNHPSKKSIQNAGTGVTYTVGNPDSKGNLIQPWWHVIDLIGDKQLDTNDLKFFNECVELVKNGWNYYSRDRSVNGIFEKTIEVEIPTTSGRELFHDQGFLGFADGSSNDLDTVLNKFSVTLKHIVASIPIIGQEFPTQQHLGSIEPVYSFEFLTTDKQGMHDGLGPHVQSLEAARLALQQNGRNIKSIYDCWMADTDTFITRFLGTYRDNILEISDLIETNRQNKKVIISGSNVSTIRNQPGLSVYTLQLEESQPFVGEALVKTNQASNSSYESIYRKMIKKILEISKKTNLSKAQSNAADVANKQGFFTKNILYTAADVVKSNIINQGKNADKIGLNYLQLDSTNSDVVGLTTNEQNQLEYLVQLVGLENVLAQLILFEGEWGGVTVKDLYGLETITDRKAVAFLDTEFSTSCQLLYTLYSCLHLGEAAVVLPTAILNTEIKLFNDFKSPISSTTFNGNANRKPTVPINSVYDVFTNINVINYNAVALPAIQTGNVILNILGTIPTNVEAGLNASLGFPAEVVKAQQQISPIVTDYIINPLFKETMLVSYLKDLCTYTGAYSFCFTTGTSEAGASIISDFFDFDSSPIQSEEVYGLASAIGKYLNYKYINNGFEGTSPQGPIKLTTEAFENSKYGLIKSQLESILRANLANPFMLKFFGITEDVANLNVKVNSDTSDALPDLSLPKHPYYDATYLTPPDFYYYNYHEDGQYSDYEYVTRLTSPQMDANVEGTYNFLDSLAKGENPNSNKDDISAGEVGAYYDGYDNIPDPDLDQILRTQSSTSGQKVLMPQGFTNPNGVTGKPDTLSFNKGLNSVNWLASGFDRESTYTPVTDEALIAKIQNMEASFGSKDGYANERNEIQKIIPSKKIALSGDDQLPDAMTHFFGKEDIKQLTTECTKDIVSQKFTMKRAWPTYKLYLIEEDQTEDFLCNYDDFYHYNAVKEITIVRSREVAADTALITLQNISGLLDGSKRLVIKDTDFLYENRKPDGTFTSLGNKIEESRKPSNQDTNAEELVGSIVLRPGSNMQIRMGYSNDPSQLEVKMSGRVVDINFSNNSDIIELTVQSFGVELEQQQKGLTPDSSEVFDLTHKLLGALMFSPELKHFGRYERTTAYQFGEMKDSTLDFKHYDSGKWWTKLTGVYFRHTSEQLRAIWGAPFDFSFNMSEGVKKTALASVTGGTTSLYSQTSNLSSIGVNLLWDQIINAVRVIQAGLSILENSLEEKLAYAFASPQDDNLFPPHPKDYLKRPSWLWVTTKTGLKVAYRNSDIVLASKEYVKLLLRGLTNQKIDFNDLSYTVSNSTIFQVFHEMTLRHPNYVYAAVPYGKEYRYTMFFGVGSQRYWAKPAHPVFIERTNEIRKAISSPLGDKIVDDRYHAGPVGGVNRIFFKSNTVDELRRNVSEWWEGKEAYNLKQGQEITKKAVDILGDKDLFEKLNIHSLQEALLQYYQALTLRFEPFRRYHMCTSDTDIVSNNITVSEYSFANAVAVKYYDNSLTGSEQEDVQLVKIHDLMDDSEIRLKQVDHKNCNSQLLAFRYGVGELIYQTKQMYQGTIMLLGNSRIKPWDYLYIIDSYNDMTGVVEVEQIVEKLSFETGYICEIKPNCVVFANEVSSMPILEGLKAIVGGTYYEHSQLISNFKGNDFFNYLTTNNLVSTAIDKLDYLYDGSILNGQSIQDISSAIQFDTATTTDLIYTGGSQDSIQSTFMSGAWLLGSLFYLNKVSAGQSIIIYPLFKNGLPYTAGIPKARPEAIWTIFRGQVSAFINDLTKGTSSYIDYWKLLGIESLKAWSYDSTLNKNKAEAGDRVK